MPSKISLASLNGFNREQFVEALDGIFEHSPWVADLVYDYRPFTTTEQLHQVMVEAVEKSPEFQRMALICNHPELAGKEAHAGTLTAESSKEQSGAGLDHCSAVELERLRSLNQAYLDKFEFPFVIAVAGLDTTQIISALEARLLNSTQIEFETSITEIAKIGKIRLHGLIDE